MNEFQWTDHTLPNLFLGRLNELRNDSSTCDIKLTVGDKSIYAHKLVLKLISPYFIWMDNGEFTENENNEIKFQNIEYNILKDIVNYIYTGKILINNSNIFELMEALDMLRISQMKSAISEYIIKSLKTNTCIETLIYAKRYHYEDLAMNILEFIWENFHFVINRKDDNINFLGVPSDILEIMICSHTLTYSQIHDAFVKWMNINLITKCKTFTNEDADIKKFINYLDALIILIPEHIAFISNIKEYILARFPDNPSIELSDKMSETDIMLVFGGETSNLSSISDVECKLQKSNWSMHLPTKDTELGVVIPTMTYPRCSYGLANTKYQAFVCGGENDSSFLDSCEKYDINLNQWNEIAPLPVSLTGCRAAFVENYLYVTGGINNKEVSNKVWRYNEKANVWKAFPSMQRCRHFHGACNVRGVLYVIGDKYGDQSVEKYNENLERWTYVTPIPEKKSNFGCAVFEEFIYIFGGRNSEGYVLSSVHRYNTLTDIWEKCPAMLHYKSGMACCVADKRIYLIGGADNVHGALAVMEVYNPITGRWNYTSTKTKIKRNSISGATLKIPILKDNEYLSGL